MVTVCLMESSVFDTRNLLSMRRKFDVDIDQGF